MGNLAYDFSPALHSAAPSSGEARSYSIAELSQHFDLTMRTLRFYEEKDLLHPARRGNRRIYSQTDFNTLEDIVRLKAMGMTIAEIKSIIRLVHDGRVAEGEALAMKIARQRESEIESEINALRDASRDATRLVEAIEKGIGWFRAA